MRKPESAMEISESGNGNIYQEVKQLLRTRRNRGNPLSKYERRKELSREEQLEYQIELLKRELLKKEAEVLRLKKSIELERGDAKRK